MSGRSYQRRKRSRVAAEELGVNNDQWLYVKCPGVRGPISEGSLEWLPVVFAHGVYFQKCEVLSLMPRFKLSKSMFTLKNPLKCHPFLFQNWAFLDRISGIVSIVASFQGKKEIFFEFEVLLSMPKVSAFQRYA